MTGAHEVDVTALAYGGDGGAGATTGAYGNATASATGTGGSVTASSTARADGLTANSGVASAVSTGSGASGSVSSDASAQSIGLIQGLDLTTSAPLSGHAASDAVALIGGTAQGFTTAYQAVAIGQGAPSSASVQAALAKDPTITAAFGAHPSYFALAELGGGHSGSGSAAQTTVSSIDMRVNLSQLPDLHDLLVGAYKTTITGDAGVTDVTLKVTEDGTVLFNQSLGNGTQAKAYLHDHPFDFGQIPNLNMIEIKAELDVTTTSADSSFFAGFVIGDPPPLDPAHAAPGAVGAPELGVAPTAHHDWVL